MDLNLSFGGSYDDELYSIQQTSDGGYIATGRTKSYGENNHDFYLIKTDKNGNILWQKNYGGAREDEGYSVEETGDGGYIVAGRTRSYGSGMYDVWLVKVDSAGEKTWDKTFGGTLDDEASSIRETSDGGFIIAGSTKSTGQGMYDLWLLRIDRLGGKVWDKTFGGTRDDMGDSIQETGEGGFIVAGTTASSANGNADLLLIRVDSNGNEQWSKTFGGSGSERNPWSRGWSVQQTADGGFAMLGSTNSFGSGGYDIWFVKTDANGDKITDKVYGGPYDEEGGSLVETREGDHLLLGSTSSFGSGGYDAWLIMIDQNGEKIWDQTFGRKLDDKGYSIIQTDDGGYIFAGKMKPYIAPPPKRTIGCCDDGQPGEAPTYYDGWLVGIRSAHPIIEIQPADYVACEGQEARFNVSATGNEPILYQWLKNGSQIAGATRDTYVIPAAKVADAGSYQVRVSNACGSVDSSPAVLSISSKPVVEIESLNKTACVGSEVVLNAVASGTEPLTYQWKKNGEDIARANTNRYQISGVQSADEGDYTLTVSNICGVAESRAVHISVRSRPQILVQPISQTVCTGSPASFEVQVAGNESYTYQWQKDGQNITAANAASLSISATNTTDQGNFSVIISSDLCGSIQSDPAELSIMSMPTVTELLLPASQLACEGSDVTLAANVTGSSPITFQWMKDGLELPGANLGSYIIKSATGNDSGSYSLIVANECGQIESNASYLEIVAMPEILVAPKSQLICEGTAATFAVQAESTRPLSYQWFKDGIKIDGVTSDAYSIPEASPSDLGSYAVQVANDCGWIESNAAVLDIIAMPMILAQPVSQRICQGTAATFSVQAESTEPLSYQWSKDGVEIPGAAAETYTIPAANLSDTGSYSVLVANNCSQVESDIADLYVISRPEIVIQPASQRICQGSPATFLVQAESTEPLSYQWSKDGVEIPGAAAETYTIPAANLSDTGSYSVLVANNCSQVESDIADLDVISRPEIVIQPASQEVCQRSPATFSVQADSTEPLSYQWFKDGTEVPDATAETYTIPAADLSDAGRYTAKVANNCSQIESDAANLDIIAKPMILAQPVSQRICQGTAATFSVQAEGTEPLSYQWFKDGMAIPGAVVETYTIPAANLSDTGSYSVLVANNCSQVESDIADLYVISRPEIVIQPASQKVCQRSAATFSVQTDSIEPLSYQWFKDGTEVPDATAETYTIPAANLSDAGSYTVKVANNCSQIESDAANLDIIAKPMILAQPISQRICQGTAATFSVQAEGTEPLSYQWFKDGMAIPGAVVETYTIPAANLSDTGSYWVQVTDKCSQIESETANLDMISQPVISLQPASQKTCQGAAVTFIVEASSNEPLEYQWLKDGIEITGANSDKYTIPVASLKDTGSFLVQVRNSCSQIKSDFADLDVISRPKIIIQPASLKVCEGRPATFKVQVDSSEPLSYQWFKDGVAIPGAATDTYTIASTNLSDLGRYFVQLRDGCTLIESDTANLDIVIAPEIFVQPASQRVCQGAAVTFSLQAGSNQPLSYQWSKDGIEIPGAILKDYIIPAVVPEDAGSYSVNVANSCGQIESDAAYLEIIPLPEIRVQPESQKVCEGSTATFSVSAASSQTLAYQWVKDGRIIRGANADELTIYDAAVKDIGDYRVVVSNSCGFVESKSAFLMVEKPPSNVAIEPTCLIVKVGEPVTFKLKEAGDRAYLYQWEKNGEIIPGEQSHSYVIKNAALSDAGGYRLTVSNSCGSIKSGMSALTVVEDLEKKELCAAPGSPCCNPR